MTSSREAKSALKKALEIYLAKPDKGASYCGMIFNCKIDYGK